MVTIIVNPGESIQTAIDSLPASSGWETEQSLVKIQGNQVPYYYAIPYLAYNLKGDGKWVLISGQEALGGYFGYYWDGNQWVQDSSLVSGLSAHGWYEAPALAYNIMGDNKWTLIGHVGGNFYGYYWNGTKWIEDSSRVIGLNASGRTSHSLLKNLTGDGNWTLITGTEDGTFKAFNWKETQWIEDTSKVNGLGDIGDNTRVTGALNVFGDNKWNLIAASYRSSLFRVYYWNGIKWIEDSTKATGLDSMGFSQLAPTLGYNIRGDNKWVLISGLSKLQSLLGFFYNTIDTAMLPPIENVSSYHPLATTVIINFSYPYSWSYDLRYSENLDMSNSSWGNSKYRSSINDISGNIEFKLTYLKPNTQYYYQVYAYVPWNNSYYTFSSVQTFTTVPSQNSITVNPGQSIQDAIEILPLEGGTIELAEGSHILDYTVRLRDNNIVFKGQGRDKTIIKGGRIYASKYDDGDAQQAWMYANYMNTQTFHDYSEAHPEDFVRNVTIKDMTIQNPTTDGIRVVQGWNVNISNVEIHNDVSSSYSGIYLAYTRDSITQNSDIMRFKRGLWYYDTEKSDIINNTITDTWEAIEYNGGWTFSMPMIVRDNKINRTSGDGMYLYSVARNAGGSIIVSNNVLESAGIWQGSNAGIALVLSFDIVVKQNILRNNWNGIRVWTKNNFVPPRFNIGSHVFNNNIIYNNSANGILFLDEYAIPLSQQNFVYSNTIYGNGGDGIENSQGQNITLKNNIIAKNGRYGVNGINSLILYNTVWSNTIGNYNSVSAGTGDISADPLFSNPSAGDFHLKSQAGRWNGTAWVNDTENSPCLNTGDPTSDNSLSPWGGIIEIGAYGNTPESSSNSICPVLVCDFIII